MSKLSKIIPSQKTADISLFIDAYVNSFFVASKRKEIDEKKLTKIVKIEEVKIHIFWKTSWISVKFSGKM